MNSETIPDAELDCVGLYCPIPIAQTKEEIDKPEVNKCLKWRLMILLQRKISSDGLKELGTRLLHLREKGCF